MSDTTLGKNWDVDPFFQKMSMLALADTKISDPEAALRRVRFRLRNHYTHVVVSKDIVISIIIDEFNLDNEKFRALLLRKIQNGKIEL